LPSDSLESVYNPHTSSHGLAGVELTKLPLNALTSNQSNCNAKALLAAIEIDGRDPLARLHQGNGDVQGYGGFARPALFVTEHNDMS